VTTGQGLDEPLAEFEPSPPRASRTARPLPSTARGWRRSVLT